MELIKLKGHTYYLPGPTNVGVYLFKNGFCALIDTGIDNTAGKRVLEVLEKQNLKVKYIINTHAHPDHYGANNCIKKSHTGAITYASPLEKLFMEHNFLETFCLYGAQPLSDLNNKFVKTADSSVDVTVSGGQVIDLFDKKFSILGLQGHSVDHIGVVTPDNVAFVGDAFFSEEILEKYSLPFLINVQHALETLEHLKETAYDCYVLSHAEKPIEDAGPVLAKNVENIRMYLEEIKEMLAQPLTREDVVAKVVEMSGVELNITQYHINAAAVGAFLSYLNNQGLITKEIVDGKLYYFAA